MSIPVQNHSRSVTGEPRRDAAEPLRVRRFESPLGPLIAGATSDGVALLEFASAFESEDGDAHALEARRDALQERLGRPIVFETHDHLNRLEDELAAYFEGRLREFMTPLVLAGTPFEERVWRALSDLPYGETRSYEAIAEAVGSPKATRAVGRANGRNRITIVIPCHRVVNKNGQLGGYGGGIERKQWLLELERSVAEDAT